MHEDLKRIRQVFERQNNRQRGRRGLVKAREALAKAKERKYG